MTDPRHTHRWRTLRTQRLAQARANNEPCIRCGQPIDWQLSGNHREGPTIDHLDPISLGGNPYPEPDRLAPAHRHCNTRHGRAITTARQALARAAQDPDTPKRRKAPQTRRTPTPAPNNRTGANDSERLVHADSSLPAGSTPAKVSATLSVDVQPFDVT